MPGRKESSSSAGACRPIPNGEVCAEDSRSYAHFKSATAQNNKPQTAAKVEGLPAGK